VDDATSEEPVEQAQAGLLKGIIYWCIRDRFDLPNGHNIDSWLIECLGGGGEVICNQDTPMCCKGPPGERECSDDPADVVRSSSVDIGSDPAGDTVAEDPGGKDAVGGLSDAPGELAGEGGDKTLTTEPDVGSLARDNAADLERCLHSCPTEPGRVEGCRRNCMCRTGYRPKSDCDLIDLFQ
jgi:hypothetical protein